jgi:hypothetical protein
MICSSTSILSHTNPPVLADLWINVLYKIMVPRNPTHGSTSSSNDEKKAVYKVSAKDTRRVQLGRAGAILVLLLTALGVTLTTYKLLKNEETSNFETAVS